MKGQHFVLVAAFFGHFCIGCLGAEAEQRWVWSSVNHNRRSNAFHDERNARFRDEVYARAERDREPTTRRPGPGAPINEEIDDYPDGGDTRAGTRQYPFAPNNFNGGQIAGGGGFNNYPGIGGYGGSPVNGILVGPGGPTGIIGRPQQYYPGSIGGAGGGFPGGYGGGQLGGGGFPQHQQPGAGYGGGFGQAQGYPGAQQGGGYYNGGQYPLGNQFGGAQFPVGNGAQYPGGLGGQYAGSGGGQYHGGGPIYTEGYGLFTNGGFGGGYYPQAGSGFPQTPFGGFGFDEQNQTKRKLQIADKSAAIESRNVVDRTVDDKISKNSKKSV